MNRYFISLFSLLMYGHVIAQNMGIGTENPDPAAVLDISATSKGLLIPRMNFTQRTAIVNPPDGLMVYQTDSIKGFWYYDGLKWVNFFAVSPAALSAPLNCDAAVQTGLLTSGQAATAVSISIAYNGSNGGSYAAQSIPSTGVTGLTATLAAGILSSSSGNLIYFISGTPATSGTAFFAINIGGQSCTLDVSINPFYPDGIVYCNGFPTPAVDVINPVTGKTWMDRNLGATRAAISTKDASSYGDYYQWGRRPDGHQCRRSITTSTLSTTDKPSEGKFITTNADDYDWRSPQNINLWQGVSGINNPCPSGYRVPTESEWNDERLSWSTNNSAGAYGSPLKLPLAGYRYYENGNLLNVSADGFYWSSTISSTSSRNIYFGSSSALMFTNYRAYGLPVRCIKD